MKKILLAAATVVTLASSAYVHAAEDITYYIKGQISGSKINKIGDLKSKENLLLGLGIGCHVMDNIRADVTWDHYFNTRHKHQLIEGVFNLLTYQKTVKTKADSFMVNTFIDFDISLAKVFLGGGVGMSTINGTFTKKEGATTIINHSDNSNNLAYSVHVGLSTEFAPGVNAELAYSYRDNGTHKNFRENVRDRKTAIKSRFGGHHISTGLRFEL